MYLSSLIMSIIYFILAFIFLIFKNKACFLIGGYNLMSKEQRKNYDELKLSKDYGITFFKYGLIFLLGSIGCVIISNWCLVIAFIIWLIYFLKNVSFDNKIFDKYKIN